MGSDNGHPLPVKLRRPATFDHLRRKQRPWRVVEVCLDMDAKRQVEDATRRLGDAERELPRDVTAKDREARLAPLKAALDEARTAVNEATQELLFESIGRARREALQEAHPPTSEDEEAAEEAYQIMRAAAPNPEHVAKQPAQFNFKTYSLALIAASCISPRLTEAEWREITDEWTDGEYQGLWLTAQMVNGDGSLVSLGKSSLALSGTTS